MNNNLKHKDITGKIIGAAFEVHKFFGNGFQELIYQRALAIEIRKAGLEFAREIEQNIYYKDFPEPTNPRLRKKKNPLPSQKHPSQILPTTLRTQCFQQKRLKKIIKYEIMYSGIKISL